MPCVNYTLMPLSQKLLSIDVGHAWDKTARPGTWEHDKKAQAYEYVVNFLKGIYQ